MSSLIADFPFESVLDHMREKKWKWYSTRRDREGAAEIVRSLFTSAVAEGSSGKMTSTGGFWVSVGGGSVVVEFRGQGRRVYSETEPGRYTRARGPVWRREARYG